MDAFTVQTQAEIALVLVDEQLVRLEREAARQGSTIFEIRTIHGESPLTNLLCAKADLLHVIALMKGVQSGVV